MKIGIISDIHGYPHIFEKAMEKFKGCSMILCAGDVLYHGPRNPILDGYNPSKLSELIKISDIPILIAKGNCDSDVDSTIIGLPILEYVFYEVNGIRFIVNHGDKKSKEELIDLAKYYKANVIIRGHTHIRENEIIDGVHYINPSSASLPKDSKPGSAVIYTDGKVEFIDI
ncbi:phosphodiesterase [Clostridium cylindrosporum]|uniref:Phosphoesterase n=1 Tax=Clostridium cylindrosporum DSM 605 TaxID=1121307 RepID=A0A0J8DA11_CLOCY|nr:phosphodiesterase [Clostridium cylindrosporum]KMT21138.1 phosphodiesterase [Clostridium cylindrosporum DSM 605]